MLYVWGSTVHLKRRIIVHVSVVYIMCMCYLYRVPPQIDCEYWHEHVFIFYKMFSIEHLHVHEYRSTGQLVLTNQSQPLLCFSHCTVHYCGWPCCPWQPMHWVLVQHTYKHSDK